MLSRGKRVQKGLVLDSKFIRFSGNGKEHRKGYNTITNISLDESLSDNFLLGLSPPSPLLFLVISIVIIIINIIIINSIIIFIIIINIIVIINIIIKYKRKKRIITKRGVYEIEFGSVEVRFYTGQAGQIVQEIAARCRYIVDVRATYTEERNEFGQTKVHLAVLSSSSTKLIEILKENVDINAVDVNGNTPLITAAEKGFLDIIIVLLQYPSLDVNKQAKNGKSVMHYMCMVKVDMGNKGKWENIMYDMRDKGGNMDQVGDLGEVPLHVAVKRANGGAVGWLVNNGANVNAINGAGESALHYAVRMNLRDLAILLIDGGADKSLRCPGSGSPLDLARNSNPDLFSFLSGYSFPLPPLIIYCYFLYIIIYIIISLFFCFFIIYYFYYYLLLLILFKLFKILFLFILLFLFYFYQNEDIKRYLLNEKKEK